MSDHEDEVMDEAQVEEAIELGQKLISSILDRLPFEVVKAQIEAGAPLWFQDDDGTSALHAAAYVENEDLVRLFIEKGALWNAGTPYVYISPCDLQF